jgi:hypothetical protein
VDRFSTTAVRMLDGVVELAARTVRDAIVPSLANMAGVLSAVRESVNWIRPRRDTRGDGA